MANDSYLRRLARLVVLIGTTGLVALTLSAPTAAAGERNPARVGASGDDNSGTVAENGSAGAPEAEVESASTSSEVAEASVASLQVDRAAVRSQLAEAKAARDHQFDRWALTHLAAQAAREEGQRSSLAAAQAQQQVALAQERVRDYAMEAFMNPPALESMAVLAVGDAEQASRAHDLISITADDKGRVVEDLSTAKRAAERAAAVAEKAATSAGKREAASKAELEALEASVRTQQRLGAQIDQRLDNAMAEVAALRAVDRKAAERIEAEEVALANDSRAALDEGGTNGKAAARDTPARSASASSTGNGAVAQPKPEPTATKPSGPPPPPPSGTVTWSDVTKVGTFTVHRSIASNVQGLLSAASAAGFNLTGGGFRDPASQISLRQAHCGPSYYDIYQKPASQCTPPTAIPGRSMHEQGRALDIKSGGVLITSRTDPAYQWLAANASSYGLYNLPSEPWHWSTNGT
jgi:hypothetical protein